MADTTQRADVPGDREGGPEFDADTAVEAVGEGRFAAELSPRWGIGHALNGGYGLAVALRALTGLLPQPHPLSVTGHFLGVLAPGPAEITTTVAKQGRTLSSAQAGIHQRGRERLRVLALFGDLRDDPDPLLVDGAPPALPTPEQCVGNEPGTRNPLGMPVADRFRYRVAPDRVGFLGGRPTGEARAGVWLRFADGREPDLLGLACMVDSMAPVVAELGIVGWTPTLELTVHLRGHPSPGWLRAAVRTRFVQSGLFEEDVELWDADGRLVAQSRQLARLPT